MQWGLYKEEKGLQAFSVCSGLSLSTAIRDLCRHVDCPTAWLRLTMEYTGLSYLWQRSSALMTGILCLFHKCDILFSFHLLRNNLCTKLHKHTYWCLCIHVYMYLSYCFLLCLLLICEKKKITKLNNFKNMQ